MNYQNFLDFLSVYSLPSILIAVTISILTFVLDKYFFNKISVSLRIYAPFLLGITFYFLYYLIFVGTDMIFSSSTISMGFTSGALSAVFYALFRKIFSKKLGSSLDLSPIGLLIEGIIYPLIKESEVGLTVCTIEKLLNLAIDLSDDKVINDISQIIGEHAKDNVDYLEKENAAKLILSSSRNCRL